LDGCISAADPAKYEGELFAVLASAADSAYPPINLGTPQASAAATGMVGASWAQFHWRMPPTWQLGKEPPASSGSPGVLTGRRFLGPAPFHDPCASTTGCDPGKYVVGSPLLASIVFGPLGPTAPADPNPGSVVANDGDCTRWGVKEAFVAERDFGTTAHGERLVLSACLGEGYSAETLATLKAVVASFTDDTFPPMAAPLTPTAIASGTTAMALCTSALGPVASAELTTVGLVRTATWGPRLANGKGNLADAFPGAKDDDLAAWCWQGSGAYYAAYAVHAGSPAVPAGGMGTVGGDLTPVPSGQPMAP
ncbi:MAG: hypothetical protein QOF82_1439, partial [Frankiales bacterium]|nr:hypothetical protein [Frankiales bacterium]